MTFSDQLIVSSVKVAKFTVFVLWLFMPGLVLSLILSAETTVSSRPIGTRTLRWLRKQIQEDNRYNCILRIGYNLNVMRQSACLMINPAITGENFAALFNCTSVNRASDSIMAPTSSQSF